MTKNTIERYIWAANLACAAMGKVKRGGEKPEDAATLDPLAWWCLTEAIATGGPTNKPNADGRKK